MHDAIFHELQIHPAKPGIGVKKRLEDLVFLHREKGQEPIAYAIKNVPAGLNCYMILSPTPLRDGQKPTKFESPFGPTYPYANIEFNPKTKVVSVHLTGQGRDQDPVYTMRQCNPKVWVIRKQDRLC